MAMFNNSQNSYKDDNLLSWASGLRHTAEIAGPICFQFDGRLMGRRRPHFYLSYMDMLD